MTMRRTATALASTVIAGLGVATLAPTAHAETTVTLSGTLTNVDDRMVGGTVTPTAVVGPTVAVSVTATWADGAEGVYVAVDASGLLATLDGTACDGWACYVVAGGPSVTFNVDPNADNSVVSLEEIEGWPIDGSFTVTYGASTDPHVSTSSNPGPGPLIQQFPRPAVGSCDAAQPAGLNWGGVSDGGWGESWAQWMNDGAGGLVCTRTLVHGNGSSVWEVQ